MRTLFCELPVGTEFRFWPTDLDVWWKKTSDIEAELVEHDWRPGMVCSPEDEVETR